GFDPTQDTPIEILHTILLGMTKYVWHMTHIQWTTEQKNLYAHRLQATDVKGLSIPAVRAQYIMQYVSSLVGRQLKTITQTISFHAYDLVPPLVFQLWRAAGEFSSLIWFPEIQNLDEYLDDIEVTLANVLNTFCDIEPSKIVEKVKLHLLTHTRYDILRFEPLPGQATE
ncbi:uncharacterized protein PHACADRAFT_52557, partial [Phanerochaete carnosa HHB-10118-sp]